MDEQMIRKNNMKIFPLYKAFAWDLLFYYAIIFLFLTQVKGFSASDVFLIDAFYAIFRVVFQMLCVKIVDTFGKQKSLLLGNLFVTFSLLILIISNGFFWQIILNIIQAMGFNLKSLCEPTMLSDSIPQYSNSQKIYAKIDGKGNSLYYVFDAISAFVTGFLYVINPYIPIIFCLVFSLISTFISLAFNEPISNVKPTKPKYNSFKSYYNDMFITLRKILKSKRLKSLLLFSLLFTSLLSLFPTLRSSILIDIQLPEQYFGIVLALMQIFSSISARCQHWFHSIFKNRLLTWFSLSMTSALILTGILVVCNINFAISLTACIITILLFGIIKGPYYTLIQKYFNSFSNSKVNTKIFALKSLLDNLFRVIISYFAAFILSITNTAYVFIILGTIFLLIFIYLLNYMKKHVGLKPSQYPKEDLVFSSENKF